MPKPLPDVKKFPPTPACLGSLKKKLTLIFDTWMDEILKHPEQYDTERDKERDDYGEACAEHVIDLAKGLNINISSWT